MPPEQAAAKRGLVGRRSDVYSLGAILYHLLTGRPPFVGETLTDTLQNVVNTEPVSPRLLNPSVPPDVETLCLKCLEKEPTRRYQTAQALAEDLDRFLTAEPIRARRIGPTARFWRWCRRKPVVASLGAATLLLLLAVAIGSPIAIYRISHERRRAEWGELDARQKAYASDMKLVQEELAQNNLGLAQELLNRHRMDTDLRGWEWRYLWQQCQGEERSILGKHTNGATAVGMLADGKTVFSAGQDKCVRLGIWNPGGKSACCRIWRKSSAPPLHPMASGSRQLPGKRRRANPFCFGIWPPKSSPRSPPAPPASLTSGCAPGASPFHRTASGSLSELSLAAFGYGT
jgi:hypothetical protein